MSDMFDQNLFKAYHLLRRGKRLFLRRVEPLHLGYRLASTRATVTKLCRQTALYGNAQLVRILSVCWSKDSNYLRSILTQRFTNGRERPGLNLGGGRGLTGKPGARSLSSPPVSFRIHELQQANTLRNHFRKLTAARRMHFGA
jgi:hypothetical protein